MGANGHGDREDSGHGDGDSTDQKDQEIVNAWAIIAILDWIHDDDLNDHPHSN